MAKRRTKKQKIKAQKYRLKKEKKVEKVEKAEKVEAEPKQEARSEKKLIIKDLLKTVWISLALLGLLALLYWRLR